MHKTGTTALQNFLFLNKEEIKKSNLCYYSNRAIDYRFANAIKNNNDHDYVNEKISNLFL